MSRPPRTQATSVEPKIYTSLQDLVEVQKVYLRTIWAEAATTSKRIRANDVAETLFLERVFERWNSSQDPMEPDVPEITEYDSRIVAGSFIADLPTENGEPQTNIIRKRGAPAMLKVLVPGYDKFPIWAWTDAVGDIADKRLIRMVAPETELKIRCMIHYDSGRCTKLEKYNIELAISVARFHVCMWTKHGFPLYVDREGRIPYLRPVVFCQDLLEQAEEMLSAMRA